MEGARADRFTRTSMDSAPDDVVAVGSKRQSITVSEQAAGNVPQETDNDSSSEEVVRETKRRRDESEEMEARTKKTTYEDKEMEKKLQAFLRRCIGYLWNNDALNGFALNKRATVPPAVDNDRAEHMTVAASPNDIAIEVCDFPVLDSIEPLEQDAHSTPSKVLSGIESGTFNITNFGPPSAIFVSNLLQDAASLWNLSRPLTILTELHVLARGGRIRFDRGAVMRYPNSTHIMAFEVVLETGPNRLSDASITKRVFDNLVDIQTTFGTRPFGIISDGRYWRVCWLGSEQAVVNATTIEEVVTAGPGPLWDATDRRLRCSPIYDLWETKQLMRVLVSALLRAHHAVKRKASIINAPHRYYPAYSTSGWTWRQLPDAIIDQPLRLAMPNAISATTIYSMISHATCRNFALIATDGLGALFVVKCLHSGSLFQCDGSKRTQQQIEKDAWLQAWDVDVQAITFDNSDALILPFVITCTSSKPYHFPRTPRELLLRIAEFEGAVSERDEALVTPLFEALQRAGLASHTPQSALQTAVAALAQRRLAHKDLEWRHVGLLFKPGDSSSATSISSTNTSTGTLRPVLIDLDGLEKCDSEEAAAALMQHDVKWLLT